MSLDVSVPTNSNYKHLILIRLGYQYCCFMIFTQIEGGLFCEKFLTQL